MTDALRLGAVSYLNAEPLIWPLEHGIIEHPHNIIRDIPSALAKRLTAGEIDCALAPVAALLDHPDLIPLPDVAIACRGAVASVLLFHNDPIPALTRIWLDPASCTSNLLMRILRIKASDSPCEFILPSGNEAPPLTSLPPQTGRLLIGDAALAHAAESIPSISVSDLGALWKELTNLPFTFALWLARSGDIAAKLAQLVRQAREWSMLHLHEIIEPLAEGYHFPPSLVDRYLRQNVTYVFGPREEAGMREFFRLAKEIRNP